MFGECDVKSVVWFGTPTLGSSQGVASPPLPNGCGRQLHGPETKQGQKKGKTSDVACSQATPWPSPLGLPRETRGPCQVHGVRDEELPGVPQYPGESTTAYPKTEDECT